MFEIKGICGFLFSDACTELSGKRSFLQITTAVKLEPFAQKHVHHSPQIQYAAHLRQTQRSNDVTSSRIGRLIRTHLCRLNNTDGFTNS